MERGYYGYKDKSKDVKTSYTVEYTRNKKVYDIMDTAEFDPDMLSKIQFDYLEDAISFWNSLYYDETVLHVMLYEQILLDGDIILEQCKEPTLPTVLDKISESSVKHAYAEMELYKVENEKLKAFLTQHGIDLSKIL